MEYFVKLPEGLGLIKGNPKAIIEENVDMAIQIKRKGKWIKRKGTFDDFIKCSECGEIYDVPLFMFNYCPNCGLPMEW